MTADDLGGSHLRFATTTRQPAITVPAQKRILLNFNLIDDLVAVSKSGSVYKFPLVLLLAHEIKHLVSGKQDPGSEIELPGGAPYRPGVDGHEVSDYDYAGSVVEFENRIAVALNMPQYQRVSYQMSAYESVLGANEGQQLTFGQGIDIGLLGKDRADNIDLTNRFSADLVLSGAGSDIVKVGSGDDFVYGEEGDDHLHGGSGSDYLDGGEGSDWAHYEESIAGVHVDLATGEGHRGSAEGDQLIAIEHLVGSDFSDTLNGDSGNNILVGGKGGDILSGKGGLDTLVGGTGDDTARYDYLEGDTAWGLRKYSDQNGTGIVLDAGGNDSDFLVDVEDVVLGAGADYLRVEGVINGTGLRTTIDAQGKGVGPRDFLDLSVFSEGVAYNWGLIPGSDGLEFKNFEYLIFGSGQDRVRHDVVNSVIDLGAGNDILLHAAAGTEVYGGSGADRFHLMDNVRIMDATAEDRISYMGVFDLRGAGRWMDSSNPYAMNGLVGYGINGDGDLVIRDFIRDRQMFVANYNSSLAGGQDTAGIHLFEFKMEAYRLMEVSRLPAGNIISAFELFLGHFMKAYTGVSHWGGVDPLVLDLDGDGIELAAPGDLTFDYDADGYGERGGWVRGDDGFLVLDLNGDGKITDVAEMFGGPGVSGFAELASHDLNLDGVIDSSDAVFSQLLVWRDLNQNLSVDAGEMMALTTVGVGAINLSIAPSGETLLGNVITAVGSFTRLDGTTGVVGDVAFTVDQQNTVWLGDRNISQAAEDLPNLKGMGTLVDLRVAMTLQPTTLSTVASVVDDMTMFNLAELRKTILPLLDAWCDASPVSGDSASGGHQNLYVLNQRDPETGVWSIKDYTYKSIDQDTQVEQWRWASTGLIVVDPGVLAVDEPYAGASQYISSVEGRWINFFERYLGEPLPIERSPLDGEKAAEAIPGILSGMWNIVDLLVVRLLMQGPLAEFFEGLEFDVSTDSFTPTTDRHLIPLFEAVFAEASTKGDGAQAYIDQWAGILNVVLGGYRQPDGVMNTHGFVFANVVAAYETVGLELDITRIAAALMVPTELVRIGDGRVAGGDDADIFYLTTGDQLLVGGLGPDTYVVGRGFGHDVIDDFEGILEEHTEDTVRFADTASTEVTARREGIDLIITVNGTDDELRIVDHFDGRMPALGGGGDLSPSTGVDYIIFSDGVLWTPVDIARAVSRSTSGNDTITGTETVDWLDGGAGDDFLSGGSDSDVYVYGHGYGHDVISDLSEHAELGGPDYVNFVDGITIDDLRFNRNGDSNDLVISIANEGTLKIVDQFASIYTGLFGQYWLYHIEGLLFDDGSSLSWEDVLKLVLRDEKTAGDDVIYGFSTDDILDGGAGNDFLSGGNENDTYVFGRGYGQDVIHELWDNILSGGDDRVIFTEDVSPGDVVFSREGLDLIVTIRETNDTLRIKDQYVVTETGVFGAFAFNQVERFEFGDGTVLLWPDVRTAVIEASQTSGDDHVLGTHGNDIFRGGAGDDLIEGGSGGDTYQFGIGDGHDRLSDFLENVFADAPDRIVFDAGILPEDLNFARVGEDLILTIASTGDSITIDRQFNYGSLSTRAFEIERFEFVGGPSFSAAEFGLYMIARSQTAGDDLVEGYWSDDILEGGAGNDILRGGDGSDTYRFNAGFGQDEIQESVGNVMYDDFDTIVFGPGLSTTDALLSRDENDLLISFPGGDSVRVKDQFIHAAWFEGWSDIEQIRFADGSAWSAADIRTRLIAQATTNGNDVIAGFYGSDVFEGGAGNDTLEGYGGGDLYLFGAGAGHDVIYESVDTVYEDQADIIRFDGTVPPSGVVFGREGEDLLLTYSNGLDSIRVVDHFIARGFKSIERVEFADGVSLTKSEIAVLVLGTQSTEGDDIIVGTTADDLIAGGAGDDRLQGRDGSDTYYFASGFGADVVEESVDNAMIDDFDVIDFGTGLLASDAVISRDGMDFVITFPSGDSVRVENQFAHSAYFDGWNDVEEVRFADGTVWDASFIRQALISNASTSGADQVHGFWTADIFSASAGNDIIYGYGGGDTYHFGFGSGHDVVVESIDTVYEDFADTVTFAAGVAQADVTFVRAGQDLRVVLAGDADSLTIRDAFARDINEVEMFTFADGSTITFAQAVARSLIAATTDANDRIQGSRFNDDIAGGKGADRLEGNGGDDRYHYAAGHGQDVISDTGGTDRIVFGAGVGTADVRLVRTGDDLMILIGDGRSDAILVEKHFVWYAGAEIEALEFAGGAIWDATAIAARIETPAPDTVLGSFVSDDLVGTNSDDVLTGGQGDDSLRGGQGSDTYEYRRGDGSDTILDFGGSGDIDRLNLRGIGLSEVTLGRSGVDLRIVLGDQTILIKDHFDQLGAGRGIEQIMFAGGVTLNRTEIAARAAIEGTAGDDDLSSTGGAATFIGGRGDDILRGSSGDDTYIYASGDGNDDIRESALGIDTLKLVDLVADQVRVQRFDNDLIVRDLTTGQTIKMPYQYLSSDQAQGRGIEQIAFSDGVIWNKAEIFSNAWRDGTEGADTLTGAVEGERYFGGLGDDLLQGGGGGDIYLYRSGDGSDVIQDTWSDGEDILQFSNLKQTEIALARAGSDLKITDLMTGHVITVINQFASYGLETIRFADGAVWNRDRIAGEAQKIVGTAADDVLTGTNDSDRFDGDLGDDFLAGKWGGDTYLYASGDGNDYIDDEDGSTTSVDVLELTDIASTGVTLTRDGLNLLVEINATRHVITIDEQFWNSYTNYGIEQIVFSDRVVWDRAQISALVQSPQTSASTFQTESSAMRATGAMDPDLALRDESTDQIVLTGNRSSFKFSREGDGSVKATDGADVLLRDAINEDPAAKEHAIRVGEYGSPALIEMSDYGSGLPVQRLAQAEPTDIPHAGRADGFLLLRSDDAFMFQHDDFGSSAHLNSDRYGLTAGSAGMWWTDDLFDREGVRDCGDHQPHPSELVTVPPTLGVPVLIETAQFGSVGCVMTGLDTLNGWPFDNGSPQPSFVGDIERDMYFL